jgi:Toastrack DUF4097
MRRTTSVITITLIASLAAWASISQRQRAEIVDNEQMLFSPGGTIEIYDSSGNVTVDGWDRPEVDLVITKASSRTYSQEELPAALDKLEHIVIKTRRVANNRLVITTSMSAVSRCTRAGTELTYHIHAPRETRLVIKHNVGDINVHNIAAGMDITARIGDIALRLPEKENFLVDAKARVGSVCSEWPGALLSKPAPTPVQLRLRVGIGEITVRKAKAQHRATGTLS